MNPVYKQIISTNPRLLGWATVEKAISLANLVFALKPAIILEIGVWGGRSLIPMAMACKSIGYGLVVGVDPWDAQVSASGQVTDADRKWWGEQDHEMVYQNFKREIRANELEPWVEIIRRKSGDYYPPDEIGMLHLDGNHGPDALTEIIKFGPKIALGGICVLDDTNWSGGNVENTGQWLLNNGFMELHPLGTGKVYFRKP